MKMKKFALRGMVILAVAVALCIFFSGTVRSLTTPKVRFAQVKMGRMEQETELKGQVVFPAEEEVKVSVPEGLSLTVTRVYVTAGDKVKKGDNLIASKVTDGEKTLEKLKKDAAATQRELRALELHFYPISMTSDSRYNNYSPRLLEGEDAQRVLEKMRKSTGVDPGEWDGEEGAVWSMELN